MFLTRDELIAIAEKSSSLQERLDGTYVPVPTNDPNTNKEIETRLKVWADVVAEGDQELFEKRLAYDSLDVSAVRPLLAKVQLTSELPYWTQILNSILRHSGRLEFDKLHDSFPCLNKNEPLPFEELLLPFILTAREKLDASAKCDLLTGRSGAALERFLLTRLSDLSSRVLELEFNTYRACLQLTGINYRAATSNKTSRKYYLDFAKKLSEEGLAQFFKEYPVLARRLAMRINQWVHLVGEFVARLRADLTDIKKMFFENMNIGKVTDLEPGLSDSHYQGRTVIAVTFETGCKLIYKPKDMGLEEDFFQFVEWLNTRGAPIDFRVLKVLNRSSYGWVEFVRPSSMDDEGQVQRFFLRSGNLLCLIYACDGLDFHNENVLACHEYPVPIDLETIVHHRVQFSEDIQELTDAAKEKIGDSVLRTHYLPTFYQIKDKYLDISGLGGGAQEIMYDSPRWKFINTDAMEYSQERLTTNSEMNIPRIKNKSILVEHYTEYLADGFRQMYRFLVSQKATLLSDSGPLFKMLRNKARFVFRPTSLYRSIEKKIAYPDYQKDGVDLSLQIDILARSLIPTIDKPRLWPLLHEETNALWDMDVPKFMVPGDSDSIDLNTGVTIAHSFSQAPSDHVMKKIMGMNDDDMKWQEKLIKGSLECRLTTKATAYLATPNNRTAIDDVPPLDKNELLQYALLLATEIGKNAMLSKNGEPSWVILKVISSTNQRMLQSMDFNLYDGVCGVALFLAAVEKLAPGSGFQDMARSSLGPMIRWLNKTTPKKLMEASIGGCSGLPSMAYSLVHLSDFLNDPALLTCAERVASLIEQKDIDADKTYDVISGAAGTILALLPLYKRTGNKQILNTVIYCGEHLLKNKTAAHKELKVWKTLDSSPPLAGFSHGAAGIAYALVALYRVTRRNDFLDAAVDAIMFESDIFDSKERNWPDRRENNSSQKSDAFGFMCAWCQGAAGIGLARTGGLDVIDSLAIRNDIQVALHTTLQSPFQARDHICCGNAGRAEILLTAGLALSETKWIDGAKRLTSAVIARARGDGRFTAMFDQNIYNPSMYQGAAGLGYHLLRFAEPKRLPCLILFE
jgi:type 2 lantibiotic biosynthesis protein LanM